MCVTVAVAAVLTHLMFKFIVKGKEELVFVHSIITRCLLAYLDKETTLSINACEFLIF